ncbi:MAG: hypothetical protein JW929_09965 [Anaerolineales bacterium]|nr:hypothetical protein [Anaerolineales bacterium]
MPSRDHREKSSELFERATYPLAKKVSFREAFPEIEKIYIEVLEYENVISENGLTQRYDIDTFPGEFIDCSNRYCFRGGISLGQIIRSMVSSKKTLEEDRIGCKGNETSPKGKKIYQKCLHSFKYSIKIEYKTTAIKS